ALAPIAWTKSSPSTMCCSTRWSPATRRRHRRRPRPTCARPTPTSWRAFRNRRSAAFEGRLKRAAQASQRDLFELADPVFRQSDLAADRLERGAGLREIAAFDDQPFPGRQHAERLRQDVAQEPPLAGLRQL